MNNNGSTTVESIISLTIFLIIIFVMIFYINSYFINENINQAIFKSISIFNKTQKISFEYLFQKNLRNKYNHLSFKNITTTNKENKYQIEISYDLLFFDKIINFNKKFNIDKFIHKDIYSNSFVYITETGSKYHKTDCRYLYNSKIKINVNKVVQLGYNPCKICFGGIK